MSLFAKQHAFLLLRKDSLQIITESEKSQQLTFPPEVVKHQQIIDRRLFEKIVTDFFLAFKKHNGTLFLVDDIIFQKQLPLHTADEDIQAFFDAIPFPKNTVAKKIIKTTQNTVLFAVNRDLYQTIILIANKQLWEINEVLPIILFSSYLQGQEISYKTLNQAIVHKEFREETNFLNDAQEKTPENPENVQANSVPLKQYLMLIGSLLFLFATLAFAAVNLGFFSFTHKTKSTPQLKTPQPTIQKTELISPTVIPTSPSEPVQDKKNVTIQITNGSGITGQAGVVNKDLTLLGYPNAQLDSEPNTNTKITSVIFSNKLNPLFKEEILKTLQNLFTDVSSEINASDSAYDVSIITGEGIKQ